MTKLATIAKFAGFPPGFLFGGTLSNGADATNDINIAAGYVKSTNLKHDIIVPPVTRELDALFGTGNGGRFDTSISDGTWHVFGVSDGTNHNVGMSKLLDPTAAPNYPSGYSYRRLGSILRESASIVGFLQDGDLFLKNVYTGDHDVSTLSTTPTLFAIKVPVGIRVRARMSLFTSGATSRVLNVWCPDAPDQAASGSSLMIFTSGTAIDVVVAEILTNTAAQIKAVAASASTRIGIVTQGWIDTRGRLG